MDTSTTAQQVWIFIKESDQWHHKPLYLSILDFLRAEGVAGATVFRGIAGYGARREVHTASLVELASDLPLVIIFVDRPDRVERIMPRLSEMVQVGMISAVPVSVLKSGHRAPGPFPAHLAVADVMTQDVALVQPETPVSEIVTLLIDRALRALPVVDADRRVVRIITDGDIRRALQAHEDIRPLTAADVMVRNQIVIRPNATLGDAARQMEDRPSQIAVLPVVSEDGRCLGVLRLHDIYQASMS